jgi:hypothetical protein
MAGFSEGLARYGSAGSAHAKWKYLKNLAGQKHATRAFKDVALEGLAGSERASRDDARLRISSANLKLHHS